MIMTPTGALYSLRHRAKIRRENVAFVEDKEIWTYERLAAETERLAVGLVERGLREGDRVAVPMVHASGLFTMLACIRFGTPFVLLERFVGELVSRGPNVTIGYGLGQG
jgi:acyl-coenzyme A synthetase/AMP-(fatty) acid ligase